MLQCHFLWFYPKGRNTKRPTNDMEMPPGWNMIWGRKKHWLDIITYYWCHVRYIKEKWHFHFNTFTVWLPTSKVSHHKEATSDIPPAIPWCHESRCGACVKQPIFSMNSMLHHSLCFQSQYALNLSYLVFMHCVFFLKIENRQITFGRKTVKESKICHIW